MMDIKTDNSAVIATLNKRIENLERYNLGLANESCSQQRKIAELEKENACLNSANNTLHNLMVSGEKRGVEKATQEFSSKIAELEKELSNTSEAFNEAIAFAISDDEPRTFLKLWNEGEWDVLNKEWPQFVIHKSLKAKG